MARTLCLAVRYRLSGFLLPFHIRRSLPKRQTFPRISSDTLDDSVLSGRLFFAVATGRESYIYADDFLPEKISPAARRTADRPVRQVRSIAIAVAACRGLLVLDRRRYTSVPSVSFRLFPWPLCEPPMYITTTGPRACRAIEEASWKFLDHSLLSAYKLLTLAGSRLISLRVETDLRSIERTIFPLDYRLKLIHGWAEHYQNSTVWLVTKVDDFIK